MIQPSWPVSDNRSSIGSHLQLTPGKSTSQGLARVVVDVDSDSEIVDLRYRVHPPAGLARSLLLVRPTAAGILTPVYD
jgi:hypothetical protein